jgi:hypothetical protein
VELLEVLKPFELFELFEQVEHPFDMLSAALIPVIHPLQEGAHRVLSKRRGRALRTPTTPRPASASASAMTPTVRLSLNYCSLRL